MTHSQQTRASDFKVFYINLDRRNDRKIRMESMLDAYGLDFERVAAVDGSIGANENKSAFLSPNQHACWESHLRVFEHQISQSIDYCLVLEDDALFDNLHFNHDELRLCIAAMKKVGIGIFQLGWIEEPYRKFTRRGLLDWLAAVFSHRIIRGTPGSDASYVLGEFRAGAHAYIVSKDAAMALRGVNSPATLAADDFYTALALSSRQNSFFLMARHVKCMIRQSSRILGSANIDSDIS